MPAEIFACMYIDAKLRTNPDEIAGDTYCLLRYRGNDAEAEAVLAQIGDKTFAESLKASF